MILTLWSWLAVVLRVDRVVERLPALGVVVAAIDVSVATLLKSAHRTLTTSS